MDESMTIFCVVFIDDLTLYWKQGLKLEHGYFLLQPWFCLHYYPSLKVYVRYLVFVN